MRYDTSRNLPDYEIAQFSREVEEQRLVREFADYLNVGEISGTTRGVPKGSVIEAEFVHHSDTKVEVVRDSILQEQDSHSPITVLLHKDERADIRSIEVICSCGKRAVINLEYDGDADETTHYSDYMSADGSVFTEFSEDLPGQSG